MILKPAAEQKLACWIVKNSMINGWIHTSIDPVIQSTITHVSDAHKLWNSLKHRFYVNNSVHKYLFEDEITNCKQNGQHVFEYY